MLSKLSSDLRRSFAKGTPLILLLLVGCSPSVTETENTSNVTEIDQARAQFEAAVAGGDPAAFGALVYPDTVFIQPATTEWDAMRRAAAGAPFPQGAVIQITPLETKIFNEEWAYDFGASRLNYPHPETGEEIELRDTNLLILRNTGSGWKPYREVASASPPPAGWPVSAQEE